MYGGNGQTTFALPDLRDRTAIGTGDAANIAEILGSNHATILSSNIFDLQLIGTSDPNTLFGGAGNDSLDGAGGADAMTGSTGNDVYFVDNAGDAVIENAGQGNDVVFSTAHLALSANVEILHLQGNADLQGYGNGLVNMLTGNSGNNLLDGGAGADALSGGAGNDVYIVDNGGDAVTEIAGQGNDTVYASINYRLTANVDNLILQGSALQGYGNNLTNALYGNSGNNLLDGNAGADSMFGGAGDDSYIVDNAGDQAIENAGEGTDTVFSSLSRAMGANIENLNLTGAGNVNVTGNNLANAIAGNSADNTLDGGAGADTLYAGAGNDAYVVDNAGDQVIENAGEGNDSVYASVDFRLQANLEYLILQGGAGLQGYGNGLANALYGNSGNNLLDGDIGGDSMYGGAGNDAYVVDNAGDIVIENAGEGNDTVYASVNFGLSANLDNLILQGSAGLQGYGNALVNALYGNSGNNLLNGNGGADVMTGGAGNDQYYVVDAGDQVIENAGEGNDTVYATAHFGLSANVDNLILEGGGDLQGYGNALVNLLVGNTGNNLLNGRAGADTMMGGLGNDVYFVDDGNDLVSENLGEGNDTIYAEVHFILAANVDNLVQQGSFNLGGTGNALANGIFGNSGDNTLDGQGAADVLTGNAGNDTFVFNVGQAGGDTVADFAGNGAGVGDSLRFVGYGTAAQGATFTQIGAINQWLIHSGLGGPDETITFMNGAPIDASDYVFI
jgi:Ca2+-binding RTX toxin-like protein